MLPGPQTVDMADVAEAKHQVPDYDGTPTSPADVEVEVEVEPEEPAKASSPLKLKLKGKATSEEVASASSAKADSKPSGSTVQRSDGPSYEEFCQHSASHTEQICCFIAAAHGAFKLVL